MWTTADGRKYALDELSDTHLQNIVVMTISSHSYKVTQLQREARRRQLFLRDGWQTNSPMAWELTQCLLY